VSIPCERVRVLVVDDHTLFAEGTVSLLTTEPQISVVGIANTGAKCMELVASTSPDVVLLDINLPDTSGTDLIDKIKQVDPKVKIVMLTGLNPRGYVNVSLSKGALGFLLKDCSAKEMTQSILRVYKGDPCLSPNLETIDEADPNESSLLSEKSNCSLTQREAEIMDLIYQGLHNREIAGELGIKVRTVDFHVGKILLKLGVSSRLEAVLIWVNYKRPQFK